MQYMNMTKRTEAQKRAAKKYAGTEKGRTAASRASVKYQRTKRCTSGATRDEPVICECCGNAQPRRLCLDHCHITGKFRGWLCHPCNMGIGLLGDSIDGLQRATDYLTRNLT